MAGLVDFHTAGTARTVCSVLLQCVLGAMNDIQNQTHSNTQTR